MRTEFEIALALALPAITIAVIGLLIRSAIKRRNRMEAWAEARGWTYRGRGNSVLETEFARDDETHVREAIFGTFHGHQAAAFTLRTSNAEGNNPKTYSMCTMRLDGRFPSLTISKERRRSRLRHIFSGKDIDFESSKFSRTFEVVSSDRAFAYAVCTPQMMEYLLSRPIHEIEFKATSLVSTEKGKLDLDSVEQRLAHLHRIQELMPANLFERNR